MRRGGGKGAGAAGSSSGNDVCLRLVKCLYAVVLVFGVLLALVTLHGFQSVSDPVTPIGILDKLSFVMGVHDKQAVTVLHIGEPPPILHINYF